jgi:hypothetical protein
MAQTEEVIDPQPDTIGQKTFDEQVKPIEKFSSQNGGTVLNSAFMESPNFKSGVSGWKIDKSGDVEFNDGIFRGNVNVKSLTVSQNYKQVAFESLTSWAEYSKEGSGAGFSLTRPGMCRVNVGNTATNNKSILGFEHGDGKGFSSNYDCFFQVTVKDDEERLQDIGIAMGTYDPFTTTDSCFGIRYILADKKVYGFYVADDNSVYTLELSTGTAYMDSAQIWRAEWNATTKKIKFYFNEVYKGELDTNSDVMTIDTDPVIAFGGKQKDSTPTDNWYSLWTNMYLYFNN